MKIEVAENDTKKIEYEYDENIFTLNKKEVSSKSMGKKTLPDDLIITCDEEFGDDQYINVIADELFAGRIKILANDKAHRRRADIIFVKVETALSGLGSNKIGNPTGRKAEFTKYFNQAYANANYETVSIDLSSDSIFNSRFASGGRIVCNSDG